MLASSLFLAGALVIGPAQVAESVPPRTYRAVRAEKPIVVDGLPDDEVWSHAPKDDRFLQRQPDLGEAPPLRTVIQVAYNDKALYVLVTAEGEGDKDRVVRTLRRDDFSVFSDDAVSIKIDSRHDRRSALTFGANVDGTQVDSMTLEDGRLSVREWDAVWRVESTRTEDGGYRLEFEIPFAVLGIKDEHELTMGLNVSRDHSRLNATYDWRVMVPPRHPVSASGFGTLEGISGVRSNRALEFTPYVLARTDFQPRFTVDPRRSPNLAAGADFRVQIGAGSYVEATALTDFAQVEADEVQVARDRFPLFFPERRPFFINGLDVFNFGQPKEAQLFFSRRIGLDGGRPVPIAAGAKTYGRAGGISYGVLNVQTMTALPHDEDDEDAAEAFEPIPPENYSVARIRAQTGRRVILGMLGTGRHRFEESGHDAFSGGIDAELRSKNGKVRSYGFVASSWFEEPAQSREEDEETGDLIAPASPETQTVGVSGYGMVEYQGLYVRPRASWLWSDADFQAPLGFYRRPGTAKHDARIDFAPRPNVLGLREIVFGPRGAITTDPDYSAELTRDYGSDLRFNWRNGWQASFWIRNRADWVLEPFALYLYTVEARRYHGLRYQFSVESPGRSWISGRLEYQYSQDFGGETHQPQARLRVKLGKHFSLGGTYTQLIGHLANENNRFNFGFANGSVLVAINRNIAWDNLIRYSMAPGAERVGLQSRVRWRYLPGSDLFLVYRTDQPIGLDAAEGPPRRPFHELTLKVSFYLRTLLPKRRRRHHG